MANLSNSQGEGGSGGNFSRDLTYTGYGTHDGKGNVPTGAQFEKGTGYDEHGQVATSFGKWKVAYDPVTGMAVDNDSVTAGYDFPAGGDGGGGLVDVSAPAGLAGTGATADMQRQLQEFLAAARQQQGQAQPTAGAEAAEEEAAEDSAGDTGAGGGSEG
ncbi:hypothetical protein ACK3TF_000876 [Chlorella vulgaris]